MSELKKFSHEKIYNNIKDFCDLHNITLQNLKSFNCPPLIYEQIFVDNETRELFSAFNVSEMHDLHDLFSNFLSKKYLLNSKLKDIVEYYHKFFNENKDFYTSTTGYATKDSYIIDNNDNIQKVKVFMFSNLMGMEHTLIIERNDSYIIELENKLFNYYKEILEIINLPKELNKPLSQMNNEERNSLKTLIP